jgi:hypothetical protein
MRKILTADFVDCVKIPVFGPQITQIHADKMRLPTEHPEIKDDAARLLSRLLSA